MRKTKDIEEDEGESDKNFPPWMSFVPNGWVGKS
jgi:hypothetical protein